MSEVLNEVGYCMGKNKGRKPCEITLTLTKTERMQELNVKEWREYPLIQRINKNGTQVILTVKIQIEDCLQESSPRVIMGKP